MIFGILWLLCGVVGFVIDMKRNNSGVYGLVLGMFFGPFGLYFLIYNRIGDLFDEFYLFNQRISLGWIPTIILILLVSIGLYENYLKSHPKSTNTEKLIVLKDTTVSIENSYKSSPKYLREEKITRLENELKKFDTTFDNSQYRGSLESLKDELKLFNNWSKLIEENEGDTSEVVQKLIKKLKSKVISLQTKEFPLMRKEFCVVVNRVSWKDDIEVKCQGSKNTTIRFIGSFFSLNQNISLTQSSYRSPLEYFRFKKSQYLWFKYDEDYTTYTILSPEDNEIRYVPNLN